MNAKLIGGILLIVGTSIGGGMLALPVATAQGGFLGALLLLFGAWLFMTFGAFLILEVNLWYPQDSNIISMAKHTLGPIGEVVAWITYLLLLYSLLAAYIAGGSDIFHLLLGYTFIKVHFWLNALIFTVVLGFIVYLGIESIDLVNRGLMTVKLGVLVLLIVFITPHIYIKSLEGFHSKYLLSAVTVVLTSFGFATIVPSLRSYFNSDVKKLRKVVLIGSLIPLICYIAWVAAVLGTVPLPGKYGMISVLESGHVTSSLTHALIVYLNNPFMTTLASTFTSVCVLTSFLGVSLCLSDFLADGFRKKKQGYNNILIYGTTFIPPYILVLIDPKLFIIGLSYAGILCAILLALLPALMVWHGRYIQKLRSEYQARGGKAALILIMLASIGIIAHELLIDFQLI